MQDKYFKASEWQKVAKNLGIDDKKFVKSLADAQQAKEPDKILAALDEVKAQVDQLRKSVGKPDKAVAAYFEGLNKSIVNEKKEAVAQKNAPAKLSAEAEKLLVTRTRAGLKAVLGGKEMQATIGYVGQQAALCILPDDATKPQRDLLAEAIGEKVTPKYIYGTCVLQDKAYTFLVKAPASGLTKKIFNALRDQLGKRYPVVTRGLGGQADDQADPLANQGLSPEVDTDTAPGAEATPESGDAPAEKPPQDTADAQPRSEAPPPPTAPPAPRQSEGAVFNSRLNALMPRIQTAAPDRRGEIVRIVKLAGAAAHARTFDQAQALLDQAEALMRPAASTQGMPASLRAAIEGWQQASETVDGQLARLQAALARSDDPDLVEISELGFSALSGNFRVRLLAGLREMDRAEGDALRAVAARTLPVATGLREHLQKDPLVIACDTNPFGISVTVAKTLGGSVASLCSALQEVAET